MQISLLNKIPNFEISVSRKHLLLWTNHNVHAYSAKYRLRVAFLLTIVHADNEKELNDNEHAYNMTIFFIFETFSIPCNTYATKNYMYIELMRSFKASYYAFYSHFLYPLHMYFKLLI